MFSRPTQIKKAYQILFQDIAVYFLMANIKLPGTFYRNRISTHLSYKFEKILQNVFFLTQQLTSRGAFPSQPL